MKSNQSHAPSTLDQSPPTIPPSELHSIFDKRQKVIIVCLVSLAATFSGFASNIYFPALPSVARDLSVSVELINLTVTTYLIFQGIAPSLWGPISDVKGRRLAYIGTFIIFLVACVGLAESRSYVALIILRCLQSTGSASTIAIGAGVIGDITTRADRGGFMGYFQLGSLLSVAVGPVIGGALAGSLGWRSIFWFLAIYSGVFLVLLILFLPETLRCIVANGAVVPSNPISHYPLVIYKKRTKIPLDADSVPNIPTPKHVDITGPFKILVSKQASPIIIFLALYYTVWQMSITAMSTLFQEQYHLGETQIGLTFIANGAGCMVGTLCTGKILDAEYHRVSAKYLEQSGDNIRNGSAKSQNATRLEDNFPLERARLRLVPIFCLGQCLSIILFGWTVQFADRVHIAVPIITTFITGLTAVAIQSIVMTYLVDVFSDQTAAASASLNLARCLLAAGGTSVIVPMIKGIGVGWAFSLCVLVLFLACTGLYVQYKFGEKWRRELREGKATKSVA